MILQRNVERMSSILFHFFLLHVDVRMFTKQQYKEEKKIQQFVFFIPPVTRIYRLTSTYSSPV